MRLQRFLIVLTILNLGLLVFLSAPRVGSVLAADAAAPVVRARAFQLVDDRGRVRASLAVLPAGAEPNGAAYPETVLLRLITERGRPSVKISATEQGSGLTVAGPTGTQDTYVVLQSKGADSSLKLRNEDGRERTIRP